MPEWLPSLLSPLAALMGAYLGARAVGRRRYRDDRRIEAAEKVLGLLYELQDDFTLLLDLRGFVGTPADKRAEAQLFTAKLNRLSNYRRSRSVWLTPWTGRGTVEALDVVIRRLFDLSGEWFNTLPADPRDLERVPPETFASHHEAREQALRWLNGEMPNALEKVEVGLIGRLGGTRRPWWLRWLGG